MKDDDKLKLAKAIAKAYYPEMKPSYSGRRVQIVLAALNALSPQLDEAVGLLRACIDGGHSYESEGQLHDAVRAFLAKQGEG